MDNLENLISDGTPGMCSNWDGLTYRNTLLLLLNVSNTYCFDTLYPRLRI